LATKVYRLFCELINPEVDKLSKLESFYNLHKSAKINLTSIKNRDDFYVKHFLDSIYIFKKLNLSFNTLIDVGSGGGFPGLVVAIFYPLSHVYLVESIGKKCQFLTEVIKKCNIENVTIINDRAENIKNIKGDIITARAVNTIKNILKSSLPLSNENSRWIIYKGMDIEREISESASIMKKYNLLLKTVRIDEPFKRTYIIITY
jgi:16S rRNA (guanine527-N7)-methyltransferase